MQRSNVVRLVTDREIRRRLKELAEVYRACWNSVNYLRMQQYKNHEKVDFASTEKEVYYKFKDKLKVNAQQVARKNAEAWRSFFSLAREKKEGKLPKWVKPRPPGYWERGIIVVRNDRYILDVENQTIFLKDFKLTLRFKGKLKWLGKQGRLEIFERSGRWYAAIPMEVDYKPPQPKGNMKASVDLGIVNLATVYFEDGEWMLFKGGGVLSRYEYYSKKISKTQKQLAIHGQKRSKKLSRLYEKRRRFLKHALNSMVRKIVETAYEKGVSEIKVGYPKEINRHHGNKLTVNFWNYNYIIRRFYEIGEEYGIKITEVDEKGTSKLCSLCGETHKNGRIKRGLFLCPRTGKVINADLNAAINILHTPESQGGGSRGLLPPRDRGNGPKTRPAVCRWTSGAGWGCNPTSREAVRMKAAYRKPMSRPKGTPTLQGGEEVSHCSQK